MEPTEGLPKTQRLYRKKEIGSLFEAGKGFNAYPFRVIVYSHKAESQKDAIPRILVSVSKKRFHHAVKRNKVKRLIRESWRRNKQNLMSICNENNITLDIAFVYTATCILTYEEIASKMCGITKRLEGKIC
ncbi:MAG: ribonuclease P protein component [Bacteroidales bacterium]|nr:ribonuclease P protein component [Bacteroidales bacterium]